MAEGQAWVNIGARTKNFEKGVDKAKSKTNNFASSLKKMAGIAAAAFSFREIGRYIGQTTKVIAETNRMSKRLGIGVEAMQELSYAAKQFGVSGDAMRDGLKELTMRVDEFAQTGKGPAAEVMKTLGFTKQQAEQLKGNTEKLFNAVTSKIQQVGNTAERQRIADELFGGQGGEQLVEMVGAGTEELEKFRKEAQKLDIVIPAKEAQKMEEFQRQMKKTKAVLSSLGRQLVSKLIPYLKKFTERVVEIAKWIKDNSEKIKQWAKTIGIAVAAFTGFKVIQKVVKMVKGFTLAFRGLNTAMKANLIFAIASAVLALTKYIIRAWKESAKFRAVVKYVWENVKYYFNLVKEYVKLVGRSIWDAFKTYFGALPDAAKVAWDSIKAVFQKGKSPAEIFKKGVKGIVKDFGNIGKEAARKFKKNIEGLSKPNYDEILASERQQQQAKSAGEKVGKSFKEGVKTGARGGEGVKIAAPGKRQAQTVGFEVETPKATLASMDHILKKNKELKASFIENQRQAFLSSGIISNAFRGMQNVISDSMNNSKNVFKGFWNFIKNFIAGLIAKLVAAAIAAFALSLAIQTIPGMQAASGFTGGLNSNFGNIFSRLSGLKGARRGGEVSKGGNIIVGESGPEVLNAPKGSMIHPVGTSGAMNQGGNETLVLNARGSEMQFILDRTGKKKRRIE